MQEVISLDGEPPCDIVSDVVGWRGAVLNKEAGDDGYVAIKVEQFEATAMAHWARQGRCDSDERGTVEVVTSKP